MRWGGAMQPPKLPVIGRDVEASGLRACLDTLTNGTGLACVIEGEAGIGKSRLVADCLAAAAERGFLAWSAAANELAGDRPFGLVTDALAVSRNSVDPARADLARLLLSEGAPGGGLRFRILDDLLELVERDAQHGPCVIALDDLQWADSSTLLALDHLAPRTRSLPVLLLVTCRPTPRSRELTATLDTLLAVGGRHVSVRPLDHDQMRQLAGAALGAEPGPHLDGLLARSGGNPFFLLELLGALGADGAIVTHDGIAETELTETPDSIRLLVLRRLSFLSEDALRVLRVASILGSTFAVADLATVSARAAVELLPAVTELVRSGVVTEAEEEFRFAHDLVREAVYDDIPRAARRDLHRDAARRLAAAGAPAPMVATQMALGAKEGDAQAVACLRSAAAEAQWKGPLVASGLLERAIEVVGSDVEMEATLALESAQALVWAGQHQRAVEVASRALERLEQHPGDPALGGRIRLALGEALLLQGRPQEAVHELERAVETCPTADGATAAAVGAGACALVGDLDRASRLASRALDLGASTPAPDEDTACLALTIQAWVADLRGEFVRSSRLIDEALALGKAVGQRALPFGGARGVLGIFLTSAGHPEAARALDEGRRHAEAFGAVYDLPSFHAATAMLQLWQGNWDDALAEIETSLTWWREHGSSLGVVWPLAMRSYIHLRRGELAAAASAVATAEQEVAAGNSQYGLGWLLHARALLAEAQGDIQSAAGALEAAWQIARGLGARSIGVEIGPDLVRLLIRQERRDVAVGVAAEIEALAADGDFPLPCAAALRCRGVAHGDPNPLLEAIDLLGKGPRPVLAAFAAEEAGHAYTTRGDPDRAASSFQGAADRFESYGAAHDTARIDATLRSLGVRRGRRGPRGRPTTGWDSLTPTEAHAVRLVAEGLTNREIGERLFISRRTVETHISHVFAKLGLSSRVELAAEAGRRAATAVI